MSKISIIGAGAMGGATVEGLIKGQQFKNEDITVSDPSQVVVEKFSTQLIICVSRRGTAILSL